MYFRSKFVLSYYAPDASGTLLARDFRHCLYAEEKKLSWKKIGLFRPFFSQKGRKTPKLGLAVVRARAKKSSEGTPQKHLT